MGSRVIWEMEFSTCWSRIIPFLFCFYCFFISLLLCLTLCFTLCHFLCASLCVFVSLFLCLSVQGRGATCMRCLWRSEDGIGYPGTGVTSSCRPSAKGAGNQTGVLWMSSKCSLQLIYLSRPEQRCWLMWEDLPWMGDHCSLGNALRTHWPSLLPSWRCSSTSSSHRCDVPPRWTELGLEMKITLAPLCCSCEGISSQQRERNTDTPKRAKRPLALFLHFPH